MPAVVSNATRIWELNIHWDLFSQCGVWDAKGRGVDIYECIRARTSLSSTLLFSSAHRVGHHRPIHPWDSGQSSPPPPPRPPPCLLSSSVNTRLHLSGRVYRFAP